jgi:hypothetical protein
VTWLPPYQLRLWPEHGEAELAVVAIVNAIQANAKVYETATPAIRHVREVGAYGQVNQVAVVVKTAGFAGLATAWSCAHWPVPASGKPERWLGACETRMPGSIVPRRMP